MPYEGGVTSLSQSTARLRSLLLLALLLSGSAATFVPTGAAQALGEPVMCLDQDFRPNGVCRPRGDPDYMQGDSITIDLTGTNGADVLIKARCIRGCPEPDRSATTTYYATSRNGGEVVFPRDFNEPGNGATPGGNAAADQAPRYNSTWEFSATLPTGTPVSRRAQVWLVDAFRNANESVMPGARHTLTIAGATAYGDITIQFQRKQSGSWTPFRVVNARAAGPEIRTGYYSMAFELPLADGAFIRECAPNYNDCYRIQVDASGKVQEIVPLRVAPADITRGLTTPRPTTTLAAQRTQNVSFGIDLYYPGGSLTHGAKLQPDHIPVSAAFGDKALRVAVERLNATGDATRVDEVPLRFVPEQLMWRAQWTIPRDVVIDRSVTYRMRLLEAEDLWRNRIVSDVLGNFTIDVASIAPTISQSLTQLERASEGTMSLRVSYHNGSPFTPAQAAVEGNESPLSGCFARIADPPPQPAPDPTPQNSGSCISRDLVWGRYDADAGVWNFTVKYPRDYEELNAHRFILQNGTEDRWGNEIFQVVSQPFDVTIAKPRVAFVTTMSGEETTTFERGRQVFLLATITYGDGSAFNSTVRPNPDSPEARTLTTMLTRRGPAPDGGYGPIASVEPLNFTEVDPYTGRWSARLDLTTDDVTPVGIWSFEFDIKDNVTIANANRLSFDREVVSSLVALCPTFQPSESIPTGAVLRFRYELFYSHCGSEREVPVGVIGDRVSAQVYRFNPRNLTLVGEPVSGVLRSEPGDVYQIEYQIPNQLYAGTYAIAVRGSDIYGNRLPPTARSRPFSTFTIPVNRSVLTEPAEEVRRGETAVVVFDALEGDLGVDPARTQVAIELHRFDPESTACPAAAESGGCWLLERRNVRLDDATLSDHMGQFEIGVDTPVGVYRFALQGRDAQFRNVIALSRNFSVAPTEVTRALVSTPPERTVKGEPFSFTVEHFGGDAIDQRAVLLNGLAVRGIPLPQLQPQGAILNVTWAIPFDAPNGNYTLLLRGKDVNGNTINVVSPPVEAMAASLEGRILGQPPRTLERGVETRVLFGITYPSGQYYVGADAPRVIVSNESGFVAEATVRRESLTFSASWTPSPRAALGEYWFEIAGAVGAIGNDFPPLRTNSFRVLPGEVTRSAVDQIPNSIERQSTGAFTIASDPSDRFAGFELAYYGPSTQPVNPADAPQEISRAPLAHTIDQGASKYIARVVTDETTQPGTYRIFMTGEDRDGNRLVSESRFFTITATAILVSFDGYPRPDEFGEEKTIRFTFTTRYRNGGIMDDTYGRPSVAVTLTGAGVISLRPEVEYVDGKWTMTWTAPANLPDGEYYFNVGGADNSGNIISNTRSVPYYVRTDLGESFGKLVPGPSPILLALVAAGVALALTRRARRPS